MCSTGSDELSPCAEPIDPDNIISCTNCDTYTITNTHPYYYLYCNAYTNTYGDTDTSADIRYS
jgi:hypothetical protein